MNSLLRSVLILLLLGSPLGAETFAEKMVLATYKLFNEKSTATGFVVEHGDGRRFVVTSGHVLEKMEGESAILVLRKKGDVEYHRHDQKIAVRKGKKALWTKHPKQDVAVLELELPEDVKVWTVPVAALRDGRVSGGERAWRGGGCLGVRVSDALRGERRWLPGGAARRGRELPVGAGGQTPDDDRGFHDFRGGQRRPVFLRKRGSDDEPLVVGLAVSQFRHTEKLETFTGKQTIHHPLGLSTVVQATAILETLELAGKLDGKGGHKPDEDEDDKEDKTQN